MWTTEIPQIPHTRKEETSNPEGGALQEEARDETVSPRCGLQCPEEGQRAGNTGGLGTASVAGWGWLGGRRRGYYWGNVMKGERRQMIDRAQKGNSIAWHPHHAPREEAKKQPPDSWSNTLPTLKRKLQNPKGHSGREVAKGTRYDLPPSHCPHSHFLPSAPLATRRDSLPRLPTPAAYLLPAEASQAGQAAFRVPSPAGRGDASAALKFLPFFWVILGPSSN